MHGRLAHLALGGLMLAVMTAAGSGCVLRHKGHEVRRQIHNPTRYSFLTGRSAHKALTPPPFRVRPVFFGYSPTCWSPWPYEWLECPPPQSATTLIESLPPSVMGDPAPVGRPAEPIPMPAVPGPTSAPQ